MLPSVTGGPGGCLSASLPTMAPRVQVLLLFNLS